MEMEIIEEQRKRLIIDFVNEMMMRRADKFRHRKVFFPTFNALFSVCRLVTRYSSVEIFIQASGKRARGAIE